MSAPTNSVVVVVDTDVVSYTFKGDSRGQLYRQHLTGRVAVIAAQTRAELARWALEHNWGLKRRMSLESHLKDFVLAPFDEMLCVRWAEATNSARRLGRTISCADAWIAATALRYDIPLVTHNAADYSGVTGLTIITEQ
jgi:predicted nucleic acid-binding protein